MSAQVVLALSLVSFGAVVQPALASRDGDGAAAPIERQYRSVRLQVFAPDKKTAIGPIRQLWNSWTVSDEGREVVEESYGRDQRRRNILQRRGDGMEYSFANEARAFEGTVTFIGAPGTPIFDVAGWKSDVRLLNGAGKLRGEVTRSGTAYRIESTLYGASGEVQFKIRGTIDLVDKDTFVKEVKALGHAFFPPRKRKQLTQKALAPHPVPACAKSVVCRVESEIETPEQLADLKRCRHIEGGVYVGSKAWLTQIPLPCLLSIEGGGLHLFSNPNLTDLSGLENLTRVGNLRIVDSPAMETLGVLPKLTHIEKSVELSRNPNLKEITALSQVKALGTLSIKGNPALKSLAGLNTLARVNHLIIAGNALLETLAGLSGLRQLTGGVYIAKNTALKSIAGLGGVKVGRDYKPPVDLQIVGNSSLENLDGLGGITAVRGRLSVEMNAALKHLHGLVCLGAAKSVKIRDNGSLPSLDSLEGLKTHLGPQATCP